MYHPSDRKNRLFFIGSLPIQSIRSCIPKLPCGGRPCSRIISCLQHSIHKLPLTIPTLIRLAGNCPYHPCNHWIHHLHWLSNSLMSFDKILRPHHDFLGLNLNTLHSLPHVFIITCNIFIYVSVYICFSFVMPRKQSAFHCMQHEYKNIHHKTV